MTDWHKCSEGLPNPEFFGPYPTVQVVVQCVPYKPVHRDAKAIQKHQTAELRFIGGDKKRPFWTDLDQVPIENTSWVVTHWATLTVLPEPLDFSDPDEAK